jgi:hypothetical protein
LSTSNTISFYWKAKFSDNFEFAQFNQNGSENIIRDFLTPRLEALRLSKKSLMGKNLFEKLEADHGLITKFGWYPFEHDLANAVRNDSGHNIAELVSPENEIDVPADSYPNFLRTSRIDYSDVQDPVKQDYILSIGLIKRSDENVHVHATKYDEQDNLIETKQDKSFGNQDLEIVRKPKTD